MMQFPATLAVLRTMNARAVALLAPGLLPAVRQEARNVRIRDTLTQFYGDRKKTHAARAMANDLLSRTHGGTVKGDALDAIIALNAGRPIAWRQIVNVADGTYGNPAAPPLQTSARFLQSS